MRSHQARSYFAGMNHESAWYEIRLEGRLDPRWATWFDGMTLAAHAVNGATQMPGHRCQQGHVFLQGEAAFKRGGEQYGSDRRRRVGGRRDLRVLQHRPRRCGRWRRARRRRRMTLNRDG